MEACEDHLHIIFWQNALRSAPSVPAASAVLAVWEACDHLSLHWSLTITATSQLWSLKSPIIRCTRPVKKDSKDARVVRGRFKSYSVYSKCFCFWHDSRLLKKQRAKWKGWVCIGRARVRDGGGGGGGWGVKGSQKGLKSTQSECSMCKKSASKISHCHIKFIPSACGHSVGPCSDRQSV